MSEQGAFELVDDALWMCMGHCREMAWWFEWCEMKELTDMEIVSLGWWVLSGQPSEEEDA